MTKGKHVVQLLVAVETSMSFTVASAPLYHRLELCLNSTPNQ